MNPSAICFLNVPEFLDNAQMDALLRNHPHTFNDLVRDVRLVELHIVLHFKRLQRCPDSSGCELLSGGACPGDPRTRALDWLTSVELRASLLSPVESPSPGSAPRSEPLEKAPFNGKKCPWPSRALAPHAGTSITRAACTNKLRHESTCRAARVALDKTHSG